MLILTRREHQSIKIGDDVEVTVVAIKGGGVRIGITAPSHVPVHREEVYRRIEQEKAITRTAQNVPPRRRRAFGG